MDKLKMGKIDQLFQDAVDFEANKLLTCSENDITNTDDFGSIEIIIQDKKIDIGWWKYKIDEHHYHIVFKTFRKTFFYFHRPYLSGIKLYNGIIENLSNYELGNYD
jgi:hypothetical protein